MLNQVPSDVQLTEVIEPLPVKPQSPALLFTGNDTLKFTGQVRVRTTLYHTFSHVPLKETFLIFASRFQFCVKVLTLNVNDASLDDGGTSVYHT